MFRYFENLLPPFPPEEPVEPPRTLIGFCLHYTTGAWPFIIMQTVLMAILAFAEVWLFGFMGDIVDWLSASNRETFLQTEGWKLATLAALVLFAMPVLDWFRTLLSQQTLMGNYPMRIRWQVHRYLLKQSMTFYQDEFAGRVATKLMQTALAVRECILKLFEVLNYVVVYFIGVLTIVGSADWRLMLPMLAWLGVYIILLRIFIPKIGRVAEEQADARSSMTGRVVDSYANIQTVKLFSHAKREASYAKEAMGEFMDTVYRSMRLGTALFTLLGLLNSALLVAVGWLSISLWLQNDVTIGSVAVIIALVLRMWGMSHWIMWEMSALFEISARCATASRRSRCRAWSRISRAPRTSVCAKAGSNSTMCASTTARRKA
jgi:ATP-binding cassette subfamily B multidrug efflux pump